MILIADSGGSKTDWRIIMPDGTIGQSQTIGFNAYLQPKEVLEKLLKELLASEQLQQPKAIYFYGAGLGSKANKQLVRNTIDQILPDTEIEVADDLLAAARALCGKEKGIACIMGTGVNSCVFDGVTVMEQVKSLGYVLGDEGSGAYFGKTLLAAFLRDELPEPLSKAFANRFGDKKDEYIHQVYNTERPSQYLGSFSKFIFQHLKNPYLHQMVAEGMQLFLDHNVLRYKDSKNMKVHFTGSIAFYYANILRQVVQDNGLTVGNIIESPIAGLTLFHQKSISD